VLVAVLAYVASQIVAAVLIVATGSIHTCGPLELFGLIGTELGMAGTIVFWVLVVKHAPLSRLGAPKEPLRDVATGVVGGLALYGIAVVTSVIVVALVTLVIGHTPESPQQIDTCVRGPWLVLTAIAAVLFPPIGEETVFRGFVFQGLRTRFAFWPAALLDGVLFGMIHIPLWLLVPSLSIVGVGLAYIYNRRQSLLASMAAHATFNLVGIVFIVLQR
jgi:membrane protease YdiL (CAAX protease family)